VASSQPRPTPSSEFQPHTTLHSLFCVLVHSLVPIVPSPTAHTKLTKKKLGWNNRSNGFGFSFHFWVEILILSTAPYLSRLQYMYTKNPHRGYKWRTTKNTHTHTKHTTKHWATRNLDCKCPNLQLKWRLHVDNWRKLGQMKKI